MITFRTMKVDDIPAGLSLCRSARWNQRLQDWELFLNMSPEGCRVALDESGTVVGTVTTVRYENHFSWIGMVLVDPARQRQGIGMDLLKESLNILKDDATVKLDATPAGREVYLKLNFMDEYPLSRMLCASISLDRLSASDTRPIQQIDLLKLFESDREVFGASRKTVLEWMWKAAPQYAFLIEAKGQIKGYCFGRSGHNYTHIGPIITKDVNNAINLAAAALQNCLGRPVVVDALHHSPEWLAWLSSIGFIEQRSLRRMYRGSNAWPGTPENQFAILGPEFG